MSILNDVLGCLQEAHASQTSTADKVAIRAAAEAAISAQHNALEGQIAALETALSLDTIPANVATEAGAYARSLRRAQGGLEELKREVRGW